MTSLDMLKPNFNFLLILISLSLLLVGESVTGLTTTTVSVSRLESRSMQDFPYTTKCDKPIERDVCHELCGSHGSCNKIRIDQEVSFTYCNCPKKPEPTSDDRGFSCEHSKTTKGKCPYVCGGSGSSPYMCQFQDVKHKSTHNTKSYCVCASPNNHH